MTFEQALQRLDEIAERLGDGTTTWKNLWPSMLRARG